MNQRRWNVGIIVLAIVFIYMLLQFYISTERIQELVIPLTSGAQQSAEKKLHIVLISQEADNPFWSSVERGARTAAEQYGMELQYMGPLRINPQEQTRLLEKSIASKADAIIVQGIGEPSYRDLITDAVSSGIPVITVDTDEQSSERLAYVGTDNEAAGERMGRLVANDAASSGSIGVLVGSTEAVNQRLRLQGFENIINASPQLTIAEVRSSNISLLQASQQAEELLRSHPDIAYMVGFSALDGIGIAEAVERLKLDHVQIYAFDDLEDTIEALKQGRISASIVQQPYAMGYEAVSLLNSHFNGLSAAEQQYTPVSVIDQKAAQMWKETTR